MPTRLPRSLVHAGTALAAALSVACAPFGAAPPPPAAPAGADAPAAAPLGTMTLAPERAKSIREHLSGKIVSDWQRTLLSSPTRWGKPAPADTKDAAPNLSRRLQALGGQLDPDWPTAGINLRAAPFNIPATDRATNGMALRNSQLKYGKKVFVLTQAGRFFGLDPDNPAVGANAVTLAGTFSKTYISLTSDGSVAFCINDAGVVYAIDVVNPVAGAYTTRSRTLTGSPATVQTALFMDPLVTDLMTGATTMHVVDNAGGAHRLTWGGTGMVEVMSPANFAASAFTEAAVVPLPTTLPATSSSAIGGGALVKAPPIAVGGIMVVGDRAGNVIKYDYNTATKTAWTVNYGWPIETPCAVDVDNNLALTDIFAAAGAQLFWIPGATAGSPVYTGQYALVENAGNNAIVHANNFPTYVNTTADVLRADNDWEAFSSAYSTVTNALALPLSPNTPTSLDYDHLTHCGFLTGLPPTISAFCGRLATKFYWYYPWDVASSNRPRIDTTGGPAGITNCTPPGVGPNYQTTTPVQDGECNQSANLLSPSAIEFDDDGSYFVADTNHCQVLFTPATNTAWQRWYPAGAMTAPAYNWLANARPDLNTTYNTGRYAPGYGQPANSPPQNNFYVFAGTLFPNLPNNDAEWSGRQTSDGDPAGLIRDVGNGVGGSVYTNPAIGASAVSRGTAVNRVQGLAVGNLGLYVANRNAFQAGGNDEGQVLFIPRATIPAGTYYGIVNPQPGRSYVISNFVDPQGIDVWRHPTNPARDIVFAPSMGSAAPSANRVCKLDSAGGVPTMAGTTMAGTTGLNDPYDVGLDDSGNLFIAEHGADNLRMIAKAVSAAEGAPAPGATYNWGTAGAAGTLYTIRTGMQEISSVTFAANDPQVPPGQRCLYIAMGGVPGSSPNRIVRLDQSLYHAAVAGPNYGYRNTGMVAGDDLALGDAGDGGDGTAAGVRLAMPWRARGRYNGGNNTFETYICDRGNNRIRRIVSSAGTAGAQGYLSLPVTVAARGKPIYTSTLSLFARNTVTGNKGIPSVGLVPSRLKNGAVWDSTTVAATPGSFLPMVAPALDTTNGSAFPITPSTTGPWNIAFHATGDPTTPYTAPVYQWRLPSQAIFTSASLPEFQHLRLGMQSPADGISYFYPTSTGIIAPPNEKSPDFYTGRTAPQAVNNYCPRVDYSYGNRSIGPILSPPTIYFQDDNPASTRYVYLMNANALWRYDVTSPSAFISGTNGAQVAFAKTAQGRDPAKGNVYAPTNVFQFNSTPPLVGWNGHIYGIDIWGNSATQYTYFLNDFDGDQGPASSNMYVNGVSIAASVPTSSVTDNAGIYLAANESITEAYFGLADGRIYRMDLNASAP